MLGNEKLVFQDNQGRVTRTFAWTGNEAYVVHRMDNRRVELHSSLEHLETEGVEYTELGKISPQKLKESPFLVGELGKLKFVEDIAELQTDLPAIERVDRDSFKTFLMFSLLGLAFVGIVSFLPEHEPAPVVEEVEEHVVQIVKKTPPPAVRVPATSRPTMATPNAQATNKAPDVKRRGALAVLGSNNASQQRGGVDIGAINTSAGPGRGGGTEGSGGVQTSLYGKGLVAAPVGVGGNIEGAGGYGTKGKGGGQAGYGELSLVGASGSSLVPLGSEAIIQGGLDRDMIAAVIQRNMGQVRFCYEQGLQSNPGIAGRVAVNFTIGGNGAVKAASIANTTLNASMVEDCIMMRLKSWKFPLPEGGVDVSVTYPFLLKRVGG